MAELINLRRARKERARAEKEAAAAANRAKHGRSQAEKQAERASAERAERAHEGHRLSPSGGAAPDLQRAFVRGAASGGGPVGPEDVGTAGLDSRVSLRSPENDD